MCTCNTLKYIKNSQTNHQIVWMQCSKSVFLLTKLNCIYRSKAQIVASLCKGVDPSWGRWWGTTCSVCTRGNRDNKSVWQVSARTSLHRERTTCWKSKNTFLTCTLRNVSTCNLSCVVFGMHVLFFVLRRSRFKRFDWDYANIVFIFYTHYYYSENLIRLNL